MYMMLTSVRRGAWVLALAVILGALSTTAMAAEPIKVGLVATLSGQSAKSGEGITRGLTIPIDEINKHGGVLGGRMLELVRRDDESNPSKGQVAALELIHKEKVAVLFGGIDSPVSLAIVPIANKEHMPFMGVWAAATSITRNGAHPNFVFRVSAVDVLVDKADSLILVATVAPGAQVVKALERLGWQVPVIAHWGISGGRFPELAGPAAQRVEFVQTYSFFGPQREVGQRVLAALQAKYPDVKGPGDVLPPVGVANAYDAMHLIALALEKAGSTEGEQIRQGLYAIDTHQGLIKTYTRPFSPENHDALNEHDYIMVHYVGDQIEPLAK